MQEIAQKTLKDTMYYRNIPVFIYQINYPSFTTTCSQTSANIVNEYYADIARKTEHYCRTVLFEQALESARYRKTNEPPYNSYTFLADYEITLNAGCITSLYLDTYSFMGGAHGETKRTSDTWNFKSGTKLRFQDIYPLSTSELQISIHNQIAERLKLNPGSYFDNHSSLVLKTLRPENFYLKPGHFVIYFQQYDIAPYSTGIPEFPFPSDFSNIRFD